MKKLHVTDLTDGEVTAVFKAAAREAVDRAKAASLLVPSSSWASEAPVRTAVPAAPTKTPGKARKKAIA
jgi:hypothetical protein